MDVFFYILGFIMGAIFMWLIDHGWTDDNGEWGF